MSLKDSLSSPSKLSIAGFAAQFLLIGGFLFSDDIHQKFIADDSEKRNDVSYTQFMKLANQNTIQKISVNGSSAMGTTVDKDGKTQKTYTTTLPDSIDLQKTFEKSNADVEVTKSGSIWTTLTYGILLYLAWRMFAATSMKKRLFKEKDIKSTRSKVKFDDIAGIDEIKDEVQEVVQYLKGEYKERAIKTKPLKGLLLVGPPGNGKTLLAKAIAGEANVPFFSAAATEFENMFYGSSSKQVRELFAKARSEAPCIIFIDEIDAVGRKRSNEGAASDSIVVEMLNQMDGFEELEGVMVLAATNKPEILDPALLRPGRFDKQIVVPRSDLNARIAVLKVQTKGQPLHDDVDLKVVAQQTYGFSNADLANLVNTAATFANRREDAKTITAADFESAMDRIIMGIKRQTQMPAAQSRNTALHEIGHTLLMLEKNMPLHKVTNVPHGEALGLTVKRYDEEKYGYTFKELKDELVVLFGGRVAEELVLGEENVSTGASNDIKVATNIAWDMVTKYGFSPLGPIKYGTEQDSYLGASFNRNLDPHTSAKVYEQVEKLIKDAEDEARKILTERRADLDLLTDVLVEKETLLAHEVRYVLKNGKEPPAVICLPGPQTA